MFKKKLFLFLLIPAVMALSSGCITLKSGDSGSDGGIFKSSNKGQSWAQKASIPTTSGAPKSFSTINISSLAMDPSDPKAIYYGSVGNGLLYTYDGGDSWQLAKSLGQITVNAIAVDSANKCLVYAATANKVLRSVDCSRTWEQIYYDNDSTALIVDIKVDHYDSNVIYIAVGRGDVIQSIDGGAGWKTVQRIKGAFKEIIIDPNDSRVVYAASSKNGVYKSSDRGASWKELEEFADTVKELKLNAEITDMCMATGQKDLLYITTYYGMVKSSDGGETWEKVEIITPEKKTRINEMALNQNNVQEIYYVTDTTFYSTNDGGASWSSKKLPSTRSGWRLLLDPEDAGVIYLGLRSLNK